MNNLLFLGLVLIISIVIVIYFSNAEKEAMTPFSFVDGLKLQEERCEKYNKMKLKMNTPSCGVDNRCDHIKPGIKSEIVLNNDGKISIEEIEKNDCKPTRKAILNLEKTTDDLVTQTNFKIESMTNMSEEPIEKQIKYCKSSDITCDTMGPNCGYCDDNYNGDDMGRIMWTNRGKEGSGSKSVLGKVSDPDGKSCPPNAWYYGDKEECKKKRRQRLCKHIKSCDDFEKYADKIPPGMCGFCPTLGRAVPIKKIGDRNVPLYEPEDTCYGGPELKKYGTLNEKQCTKFMTQNPCIREQYWTGIPDHSGECYRKLYKEAGGKDSNKDADWWEQVSNRRRFNMSRAELNAPPQGKLRLSGLAPVPWISIEFKKYAAKISDKCYDKANNAWNWLTGYKYDPCVHQTETGFGNRECQRTNEGKIDGMTKDGTVSDYVNYYSIPHCDGFIGGKEGFMGKKEGFFNWRDWLRRNRPDILRNRDANRWYYATKSRAPDKFKNGGKDYKKYLREIQNVMYSGKTYELRVRATRLLKGFGHDPPRPPAIKPGDYVEYIAKEHIYRGILYRTKTINGIKKALVMWDYYFNTKTNDKRIRGPTMGVCIKDINPESHSEGDCIEGITANVMNDTTTCNKKTGNKKISCLIPKNTKVMSRGNQRYRFGWPQYPSIKASLRSNPLGNNSVGWVELGDLSILRVCKKSSEGCSSTEYNCEASLDAANKLYKKPQDCVYSLSKHKNCSVKCGGGWKYRDFKIHFPAKGEGTIKCPYGNNQKGYTAKVEWQRCNKEPCHPDRYRRVRLRWCKEGEKDPNCVGLLDKERGKGGTCYSVGNVDFKKQARKGDMLTGASCRNGGGYWDSGGEFMKNGASFYLRPVSPTRQNAQVYTFSWYPAYYGSQWGNRNNVKNKAKVRSDYSGLCLHPNVNEVEINNGNWQWGKNYGWQRGPTHARNNNISKERFCPWKPNSNFGEIYGSWLRSAKRVTRIARDSDKNYIAFIADDRYGKMCKFKPDGSYIRNSGRYVNGLRYPNSPSDLISLYKRGKNAGGNYIFRKLSGFACNDKVDSGLVATFYKHCNYGGWSKSLGIGRYHWVGSYGIQNDDMSSLKIPKGLKVTLYQHSHYRGSKRIFDAKTGQKNISCLVNNRFNDVVSSIIVEKSSSASGNQWDGLGRLGSCNSKYAKFKLIKTKKGDRFRLQREAFTGGYSLDNGNLKEGWTYGSRKSHQPGKGFYMGMQPNKNCRNRKECTRYDRLYSSDKGTIHKFDCDLRYWGSEKRVGLFTCRGGSKNGKKYPFKTNTAYCKHIDPLRDVGFSDNQLICKDDCEISGGTCQGPTNQGVFYHIERAVPFDKEVYAKNKSWWWSNAKCILGDNNNPTGKVIGGTLSNWFNRARSIPNVHTQNVKVKYYGKDQGWGNPTSWVRLVLWSGNRVIYNKDVGGRDCYRAGNCVSRGWKWNEQLIPYTDFISKRKEKITKALIVVREMGSGHRAWIKKASIEFNPESKFGEPEKLPGQEKCVETRSGYRQTGYRGCKTTTKSGKKCQKWTSQSPHGHSNTPQKKPYTGLGDHNKCRNPDNEPGGIWCYTTDRNKRWEYC